MWRFAGRAASRAGTNLRRPVCSYEQLDDFGPLMDRLGELRRAGWRSPRIADQLNKEGFSTPKQRGAFTADVVRMLFPRVAVSRGDKAVRAQPPQWTADALARRLESR